MSLSKRRSLILPALLLTVMLASCAAKTESKHTEDAFEWAHGDPVAFLEFLRIKKNDPCPTFAVAGVPDTWLKKEHIPRLQERLDSREPCANVHSIYSSLRDCDPSTVGHEAAFLIEGFRKGSYPPGMNSGRAVLDVEALTRIFHGNCLE
ncbi:hypothetical protein [Desulfoluna spongiiphila]|uniref:hypothetical protein n=1 Tax=Desulfoluna spongiiphila TaxID=419481 RepID=UPI0012528E42|nr:hypothetical protein [Desulfoluna spongiiphila]VVS95619.1 prokaryotic membrane lipoprotein lipid attachment site profile [Desulfoluna spongiiphila]